MNKSMMFLLKIKPKSESGFSLIEMLVVIVIIGILASIAVVSYLSQASKAKQSEAKLYVSSVNEAQQIYRMQKNEFAQNVDQLEIGLSINTTDYAYNLVDSNDQTTSLFNAVPKDSTTLRAYRGGVMVTEQGLALSVACQTTTPSNTPPGIDFNGVPKCGNDAEAMR